MSNTSFKCVAKNTFYVRNSPSQNNNLKTTIYFISNHVSFFSFPGKKNYEIIFPAFFHLFIKLGEVKKKNPYIAKNLLIKGIHCLLADMH